MRALLLVAALATSATAPLEADEAFIRGMVVSCPRWGAVWGEPAMAETVAEVRRLGVEWIAIHPYASIRRDGSVSPWAGDDFGYLERAADFVFAGGLQLFWKPHLAYWGSFDWRGAVRFADEAEWTRFFTEYSAFIVEQARLAERLGAEIFAVGVELDGTTFREADWRRVIAAVREVYAGRITYAANWDSVEAVPFWDAVDLIGVHAYYPLSDLPDPDLETLRAAWDGPLAVLETLSRRFDRRVLFAEIGYNRSTTAAAQPWRHLDQEGESQDELRLRLIRAAIERVEAAGHVAGMFWWKWMPGDRDGRDFSMRRETARNALRAAWRPPAARLTPEP